LLKRLPIKVLLLQAMTKEDLDKAEEMVVILKVMKYFYKIVDNLLILLKIISHNIKIIFFLLGLSMGGYISYKMSHENPNRFKGVILMAPALRGHLTFF